MLEKWAQEVNGNGFDAYVCYYAEENAADYDGTPKNDMGPFLNRQTALLVLERLLGL